MGISVELMLRLRNPGQIEDLDDAIASFCPRQLLMCLKCLPQLPADRQNGVQCGPGFWGMSAMRPPRMRRISSSGERRSSRPSNVTRPPTIRPGDGNRRRMDMTMAVFAGIRTRRRSQGVTSVQLEETLFDRVDDPGWEVEATREVSYREKHGISRRVVSAGIGRRAPEHVTSRLSLLQLRSLRGRDVGQEQPADTEIDLDIAYISAVRDKLRR